MTLVVETLRSLGGISAVLDAVIRDTVAEWESNPRLQPRAKDLALDLQRFAPTLRPRVQHFLSLVDLARVRPARSASGSPKQGDQEREDAGRPLGPGVYPEVPLINEELGWYGKADLLRVSGEGDATDASEIVDFKTGLPKPDHALQLRIYALLWARGKRRNPTGRLARKLTVVYGDGSVDVPAPITDAELNRLADELADRTSRARAAIQQHPPEPRPSREACEWCGVRQMCPAYWTPAARAVVSRSEEPSGHQVDAGVRIVHRQGAWSWIAHVEEVGALSDVSVGTRLLLRVRPHDLHFASMMRPGAKLRILAAQLVAPSEESSGITVLSFSRSTEAFAVAGGASA
jgi:hypothetical protein